MKIVTWNVNGVRAALNKGVADWWNAQNIDVLCLQEIKAMPEQLTDAQHEQFEWPYAIWNPAVRKGYSGVATFTKAQPRKIQLGLGDERFDNEGRVIQTVSSRPGRTLGELLTGRGLVRPEDLKRALEIQRTGGGAVLLGDILVEQGIIDTPTLEKVVQEQIEDAIVFFLTWKEGTFSFELADIQGRGEFSVDPQAFILEHGIDTQWLVLEGTREEQECPT